VVLRPLRLKVLFHDRCFDGTASAALFGRFYRDAIAAGAEVEPVGLRHRDGDPFEGVAFDGDDHACVDFRYSPAPELRWWFDHHATAFQPPALRAAFEARQSPTQVFDPEAPSCAGLVARTLEQRWQWTPPAGLAEAVRWAEVIDAAAFSSASEAISLDLPAQRLAAFLGATEDDEHVLRYVRALGEGATLVEIDAEPWVRQVIDPLRHDRVRVNGLLGDIGRVAGPRGDVVVFDLLDHPDLPAPGFAAYALFPTCRYTIAASRGHGAIKIAVGYNPWCGVPREHDIGALCQSLGGGGHAVVGGVTLEPGETSRARATVVTLGAALTSSSP
jgi:hypothetical protein